MAAGNKVVVTRRLRAALQACADGLDLAGVGEGRKALAAALECGHVRRVISDRALAELASSGLLVPPAKPPRRCGHAADAAAPAEDGRSEG